MKGKGKCPYLINLPITVPITMHVDGVQQKIVSGKACVGAGKCRKSRGAYEISWRCSRIGDGKEDDYGAVTLTEIE